MLDTGIQFLLYSHLVCSFKVKFSGSQCLGTGMTSFLVSYITMFVQLWIPWRYDVVAIYRQIPFS
ncbi:hypothetical protein HCR16_04690 [Wolbachia pipientis]|uniref:hypothetical protein n=1 Tax=Wolbachia pipientis TaxID=955 RepID=UPI00217527C4|nr:hypothetical protein [Wolbachia pipientis]MBA8770392.1 hypothetical protein [Wolbachia pipientis]